VSSIQHTKAVKAADRQRRNTKENPRIKQNGGRDAANRPADNSIPAYRWRSGVSTISASHGRPQDCNKCCAAINLAFDRSSRRARLPGKILAISCARSKVIPWDTAAGKHRASLQKHMFGCVRYRTCTNTLFLLLSCVLLQSASAMRAFATCGDWLAHPGTSHSEADRASSNLQLLGDRNDSAGSTLASNERPSPLACHGPFCRNAPTKPVPTVPPTTVNASDKLLLAAQGIICALPYRWSLAGRGNSAHALRGFPVDIEHPPRA
jgi:hypothetical protein